MAAAAANNAAALREAYPPPPSLFNLYGPDDGVSPLPPPPPPIPAPEDISELRERKIELNVLGNPLRLHEELVPPLTTSALYQQRSDGTVDYKGELRRLSGELLFMFLELIKTVVEQPSRYAAPLTQVNQLFSNLLHLTNTLRPHQARATLEATLRLQVDTMRQSIARVKAQVAAADGVLQGLARALVECDRSLGDSADSGAVGRQGGRAGEGTGPMEAGLEVLGRQGGAAGVVEEGAKAGEGAGHGAAEGGGDGMVVGEGEGGAVGMELEG